MKHVVARWTWSVLLTPDGRLVRDSHERLPADLDERWTRDNAVSAMNALLDFARTTAFRRWRSDSKAMREEIVTSFCAYVAKRPSHLGRLASMFGEPAAVMRFVAMPGPFNGGANYGPRLKFGNPVEVSKAPTGRHRPSPADRSPEPPPDAALNRQGNSGVSFV